MSLMKDKPIRSAEHLGAAIRLKRKQKGLSQSDLAESLGVGRKWVLRLEAGNQGAELGLVLKTLSALGLQALLSDPDRSSTGEEARVSSPRLEEVFRRLQRSPRK
jgi:y4mF family transcriptional regulator